MRRLAVAALLSISAFAATFGLYSTTLHYGFNYDDYHFVRPYSPADVAAAFNGPWDPSGIELPYYRPLTIAFFAARFELLGVNAVAHHALSLILFSISAFLLGFLVHGVTRRRAAALFAVLLLAVHPAMPYSAVAWVTNQMHLVELIAVLFALCWWHGVRRRPPIWWVPLLALAAAAFLVKEDGVMLLPSIVVLHVLDRRYAEQDLPPISWSFVAGAAAVTASLLLVRGEALHGLVSRRTPSWTSAWHNYWSGLDHVFRLAPADRPWQHLASVIVVAVPVLGALSWRKARGSSRVLLAGGVSMAWLFNLPFVFVTKPEQLHLVALGAVVAVTGGALAIADAVESHLARAAMVAASVTGLWILALVSLNITRDFEPFGPIVLANDEIVQQWAAVPQELREYLAAKREPGAALRLSPNPAEAVPLIGFGLHGRESTPDGTAYRWMSGTRTELLLSRNVRAVAIPLRHAIEVFGQPVRATIETDGRLVDRIQFDSGDWRTVRSALLRETPRLTGMHRLVISIDSAWQPSRVVRGSADDRVLGLQVGAIATTAGAPR